MLKKWIVNADDFGYSKAVNYGIIDAYQNGIVSSATLMVNMSGAEHAAKMAKENNDLGVGIHFVLTCGKPVRNDVPSLVNEVGEFHKLPEIVNKATLDDIEKELTSQIELFYSFGLKPTHIDSHHHVHSINKFYPIFKKLAEKYRLPMRNAANGERNLHPAEYLCTEFYGKQLTVTTTLSLFIKLLKYETVEIMCHPAYLDLELIQGSSYSMERLNELAILNDSSISSFIKEREIHLVNYKDITV